MLYNRENYKKIKRTFDHLEVIIDENNERRIEPAGIQHETVHIAEAIGEIQPVHQAEHKDLDPEFVSKIVFKGNTGKYWILKIPYKVGLIPKRIDIKGVYRNKMRF